MSVFLILGLLACTQLQGSAAADVTSVFVQTGGDVRLNGNKPEGLEKGFFFSWKLNGKNIIRFLPPNTLIPADDYKGRINFSEESFSLHLKNLQKSDSGLYVAELQDSKVKTTAKYNVTVVDPVSPVVLQVDSVSNSSVSCTFTVSCSPRDSDIIIISNFMCQNQICSQEGGEGSKVTDSGASLHIYMSNGLIICRHSNQVSQANDTKEIELRCLQPPGAESLSAGFSGHQVKIVVFSVGLIAMISAVISVHVVAHKAKNK